MADEGENGMVINRNGVEVRCQQALIGDIYITQEVKSNEEDLLRIREEISTKLRANYLNPELPRVPWLNNLDLPLADLYVKGIITEILKTNRTTEEHDINITDLFADKHCYRIYVKGAPGFGKTCLIYKLAFDWAKREKYLSHFDLVFVIELRYLTIPIEDVIIMLGKIDDLSDDVIKSAIFKNRKKILLLIDGYDELAEKYRHFVIPLLTSSSLPQVTILVTSREGIFTSTKDVFWTKQICLRGIQYDEQKTFLRSYFESDEEAEKIVNEIHRIGHRNMETLFCCPLFLILLAFVVSDNYNEDGGVVLPKNKTQLYKKIFDYLLRHSLNRDRVTSELVVIFGDVVSSIENCYSMLLRYFGELALIALTESRFSFTETEILSYCNNNKDVFQSGILRKMSKIHRRTPVVYYEAIHTTFLEFLAAFYLQNSSEDELERVIANLFHRWDSTLIFNFLVGLMGKNCFQFFKVLANFTQGSIYFPFYLELFSEISENCYESIPDVLAPFLPSKWHMSWERHKNGFSKTLFHSQMVRKGVQCGAINVVHYKESFVVNMPSDVTYPCIVVNVGLSEGIQNDSQENRDKLKEIQCVDLVLSNIRNNDVGKLFLNNVKSDNVYIKLDSPRQLSFLQESDVQQCMERVRWLTINNFPLEQWDLVCGIVAPQLNIVKLSLNHIVDWKSLHENALFRNIMHLDLTLTFDLDNATVDLLTSSIADLSNLDEISLIFKDEDLPTIDLSKLCNNRAKVLQKLKLVNTNLAVTNPVTIKLLILENVTSISTILPCEIEELHCNTELLQQLLNCNKQSNNNLTQTLKRLTMTHSSSNNSVEFNNKLFHLQQLNLILNNATSNEDNAATIEEKFLNNLESVLPGNDIVNISIFIITSNSPTTDLTMIVVMKWLQSLTNPHLKITTVIKFSSPLEPDVDNEEIELFTLLKQCLLLEHIHAIQFKISPHRNTPIGLSVIYKLFPKELFQLNFRKAQENTVEKIMEYSFENTEKDDDTWTISLK